MKVAVVGIGYWGAKLLRNLSALVGPQRIVAVDAHLDRLSDVFEQYPGIQCKMRLEDALENDDVEAVVIATPVESHYGLTRRSLLAGRHVLVEKPFVPSLAEARELADLADSVDRTLMVAHTFLFSPRIEWISRYLAEGSGSPHYITTQRLNLGLHRRDANVIWDLAPHDLSIILHLLGEVPVKAQTSARSIIQEGIPDVAFIDFSFPSGVIASVAVSWLAPRKTRSLVLVSADGMIMYEDTDAEEPIKVFDRGVVVEESADFGEHQLTYRYGDTVAPAVSVQEPLARELEHFLSAAASGERHPLSDARFGMGVVAALEAADHSWREGGVPIAVAPTTANGHTFPPARDHAERSTVRDHHAARARS